MNTNTAVKPVPADREKMAAFAAAQHGFPGAVNAASFKLALPAVCAKLMAAANINHPNVRVTFQGSRAFASYSNLYTSNRRDAQGNYYPYTSVNATLNLPALNTERQMPRAEANRWLGYGLHEMLHVILTPKAEWDSYIRAASPFRRVLVNAVEDARIEHAGMKRGICEGFANVGTALVANLLATIPAQYNPNSPQGFPFAVAVILRDYGGEGQRKLEARLSPRIRAVMDEAVAMFDKLNPLTSTFAEACAIADRVADLLKEMANAEQPDQPGQDGPEGQPRGKGEAGEGEGKSKGKGKPDDEGEDEVESDEPGEGEGDDAEGDDDGEGAGDGEGDDEDGDFGDEGDGESQGNEDGEGKGADGDDGDEGEGEGKGGKAGDGESHNTSDDGSDEDGEGSGGRHGSARDKRATADAPVGHDVTDFAKLDEVPEEQMVQVEPTLEVDPKSLPTDDGIAEVGDCQFGLDRVVETDESGKFAQEVIRHARVAGVRSQLRRLLERTDRMGEARGLPRGRLVSSQLARTAVGDANVFSRRWELEGEDAAVSIIVDMSGSMGSITTKSKQITKYPKENSKLGVAMKTAVIIAESLQQTNGVNVEVLGFPGGWDYESVGNGHVGNSYSGEARDLYRQAGSSSERILQGIGMNVLKGFNERTNLLHRRTISAFHYSGGDTPDLEALAGASRRLLKVQAEKRIIFMICDGDGADLKAFRAYVDMLYTKHRILCIGLGIGCNAYTFPQRFKYGVVVQDGKRLTEDCLTTLVNSIIKDRA